VDETRRRNDLSGIAGGAADMVDTRYLAQQ
jgi:hypothetical protein